MRYFNCFIIRVADPDPDSLFLRNVLSVTEFGYSRSTSGAVLIHSGSLYGTQSLIVTCWQKGTVAYCVVGDRAEEVTAVFELNS